MSYYIYKLCCDDCDDFYVGSTKSIKDRKYKHKHKSKADPSKKYEIIRANGGWDNWRMVCLEECDEAVTKRQAEMKEEEYRLELKATMNSRCAYRTKKQYCSDNSEKIKAKNAQYRSDNSENIKARQAQYYADNLEKIKAQQAQYRIDNLEKIKAQKKQYRIDNSEKIKAKASKKITCECGSVISRQNNIAEHKKTAKHCRFITNKN